MRHWTTLLGVLIASSTLTSAPCAAQGSYPDKPINLVVPVPPAGILDSVARMVGPPMSQTLGQTVIIDNRSGAGGNIAASMVARARADGYTLLLGYSMFHVGNPSMYSNLTWDPLRDFTPVAMLVVSPHIIAVNTASPIKSLKELVDYARANPGKLNYATPGSGSVPHVGMELFKQLNHIEITHVPYRGAGPAVQDVIAGNVQITIATPPSVIGFIQAGKLRPLAVAAKQRLAQLPDLPTTAEAGYPGFELEAWVALLAPKGTPPEAIARLTESARKALESPQVRQSAQTFGVEIRYMPPTELDALIHKDIDYWSKVITTAGIRVD
ncbi:tripartite tricarboxylate transporter substrate binding protein [soil metagenome]